MGDGEAECAWEALFHDGQGAGTTPGFSLQDNSKGNVSTAYGVSAF